MPDPNKPYRSPFHPEFSGKEIDTAICDEFPLAIHREANRYSKNDLKEVVAELREIRLLLQQVIGLPDTEITRAVKKHLENSNKEGGE